MVESEYVADSDSDLDFDPDSDSDSDFVLESVTGFVSKLWSILTKSADSDTE